MCTVTILPLPDGAAGGFRMVVNRDEARTRAEARAPEIRRFGARRAILPIDPVAGGTWVAASDAGLAMTLLNYYSRTAVERRPPSGRTASPEGPRASRGLVVPGLLGAADLDEAAALAGALDPRPYPPFRLVATDGRGVLEVRHDRGPLEIARTALGARPAFFTSSGLGDSVVDAPRRRLFEATFAGLGATPAAQDAFHRHTWPDRPEISVLMSRAEARTVSVTTIEVGRASVALSYAPVGERGVGDATVASLLRATLRSVPEPPTMSEWDNPGSYEKIASAYAEEFFDELTRKPFDRERLGRFAADLRGKGRVCDIGTGPGQIAAYLGSRGADAFGLDLSEAMLREGRRLCPNLQFVCGDMLALPLAEASLAGITAFYSIIHLKRTQAVAALREMRRVLKPGGDLLVAFHGGEGEIFKDEMFSQKVAFGASFFQPDEMAGYMREAGLHVVDVTHRAPYAFEYPSLRVYAHATRAV